MSKIDIDTYVSQARCEAKYARTSYEEGYTKFCLLLMVRAIEKLLMVHCVQNNVPFPRNQRTLSCLLDVLKHTDMYTEERDRIFHSLDQYQEQQEADVHRMISEDEGFDVMKNVSEDNQKQAWAQEQQFNGGKQEQAHSDEDLEEVDELFPLALRHFQSLLERLPGEEQSD